MNYLNRTITVGKAVTKMELSAALSELFEETRPCQGIPWDEEEQPSQLVIQTPVSGRFSKTCHVLLGKDADPGTVSCPECWKIILSDAGLISSKEELGNPQLGDDKEFVTPCVGDVDDLDKLKSITKSENDDNNSVQEDLNEDSDHYRVRKGSKNKPQIQCTLCDKSFAKNIFVHYMRFHLKGKFNCTDCEFKADYAHDIIKHMEENKHESHIACPYCLKKGKECKFSKLEISSHYRSCVQKTLCCSFCDETFRTTDEMLEHKKIVHLWGEFWCQQCDFR